MKNILLIGLGRFGKHVAYQLNELGHEVMAVDENENLVNEINIVSPDAIASFLPSPSQEKFLLHNREKLLMNLWYGIGNNKFMGKKHGFIGKIRKMLDVKRLTHLINTYEHRQNSSI